MIDVDKLLELEARATPGVWKDWIEYRGEKRTNCIALKEDPGHLIGSVKVNDSEFIVEMRNSIRQLCLEVKALRKLEEANKWVIYADELSHGEDCDYWDEDESKPSGLPCDCNLLEMQEAFKELDEARKG
jgi:hypothetical protein